MCGGYMDYEEEEDFAGALDRWREEKRRQKYSKDRGRLMSKVDELLRNEMPTNAFMFQIELLNLDREAEEDWNALSSKHVAIEIVTNSLVNPSGHAYRFVAQNDYNDIQSAYEIANGRHNQSTLEILEAMWPVEHKEKQEVSVFA